MRASATSTIVKIIIWSIVIGAILSALDMRPEDLLAGIGGTAEGVFGAVVDAVRWAIPFALAGRSSSCRYGWLSALSDWRGGGVSTACGAIFSPRDAPSLTWRRRAGVVGPLEVARSTVHNCAMCESRRR